MNEQQTLNWAASLLAKAAADKSYCKVVISFENGRVVRAERNESLKPPQPGIRAKETGC